MAEDWHARLSPSSMKRILICNPSAVLTDEDQGSAAATEGTLAHSFCERILNGDRSDIEFPDDEMRAGVFEFVAYVKAYCSEFKGTKVYVESQIRSKDVPDHGGTLDALLVSKEHIHVIDFKYGVQPVDAVDNKQLLSYLVLADELYPGRKRFFGSIVQPRVYGDNQCVEFNYQRELIDHKYNVLMVDPKAPRVAGGHCHYCPLKKTCDTLATHLTDSAKAGFDDLGVEKELTPARCIEIIQIAPVVAKMVDEAKTQLKLFLTKGVEVPGWRLAQSLGNRTWIDEAVTADTFKEKGLNPDAIFDTKLKSPAQIEKFSKAYKPLVAELTHRPERGIIAVETSSKLPEPVSAAEQFTPLPDNSRRDTCDMM